MGDENFKVKLTALLNLKNPQLKILFSHITK